MSPHPPYQTEFLIGHRPQVASQHPGLASASILSGQFNQNPFPMVFPLSNALPTDPALVFSYTFPFFNVIFAIEPSLV